MDALGKILIEIREDAAVAAIVGTRVRGLEPGPGDAQGNPDDYKAFVVLTLLDDPRVGSRIPAHRAVIAVKCYGRTAIEAASLRWAVSNAIHAIGPRVKANGLGIYLTLDDAGGPQEKDPDTHQPFQVFTFIALATTVAVT